jgi:NAD(P)-dependent dehydrogenase (short-subunit alcohol dehydrogenase family)
MPRPTVLITGGGSGVGLACARAFAARGARLLLCDSDGQALSRAGVELGAFTHFCEVTSESSVAIFAAEVFGRFPDLDVLINAAGDGYVRTLGMMRVTLAFLPAMRRPKTPKLVFNIAPDFAPPDHGEALFPNVASPRNFRRLSASLAVQARGSAVRVMTIMPRRAIGAPMGGAISTRCDPADVVAAVMSAILGKAAAAASPLPALPRAKRA